jgi:hypothetical protein
MLYIVPFYQIGNRVFQFARGLNYAHYLNVSDVFVEQGFLLLNRTFTTTNGIRVHVGEGASAFANICKQHWFYLIPGASCTRWDYRTIMATFRDEFIAHLPPVEVKQDILYMHFRSGGIFRSTRHPHYGQPPCAFYLDAAALDRNHSAVHIITEDHANPCVSVVEKNGGVFIKTERWDAIARLILSHRFVVSRSTFSFAAVFLAPHPQVLYTFGYTWTDMGDHWDCKPTKEYNMHVLNEWRIRRYQIKLMLRAKCERWTKIEWNPNESFKDHADGGTVFRTADTS